MESTSIYIVIQEQLCTIFVNPELPLSSTIPKILNLVGRTDENPKLKFLLDNKELDHGTKMKNINGIIEVKIEKRTV
jgi:hypothetical protein